MNFVNILNWILKLILLAGVAAAVIGLLSNRNALSAASLRGVWQNTRKRVLAIALAAAYLALTFGVNYSTNKALPTLQIVMNYEEAANGKNPNQTYYSPSHILSNDVLEQVIENCGLNITAGELAQGLDLVSAFDEVQISADSDMRIATQYKVSAKESLLALGVDARKVIEELGKVYQQEFLTRYTENLSILDISFEDMQGLDYLDTVEYLRVKAVRLESLVSSYSYENPTFRMDGTGETFGSIAQKIENFINLDLNRYHSYLLENGLASDSAAYAAQLDYKNLLLNRDYAKDMAAYDVRLEAIGIYDEQMAQIVLVPTTDAYQRFYMSRTRNGIDDFADEADMHLSNATETKTALLHNEYAIAQVSGSNAYTTNYTKADAILDTLKLELTALADQSRQISQKYISEKRNGYLSVAVQEESLGSLLDVKSCVLQSGVFALALILTMSACAKPRRKVR